MFLYLPILFMIVFSFDESATPGLPITGFTLHWYEALLNNRVLLRAVGNSITVAVIVSILATIIGTMAAFVLVRGRSASRTRPASSSPSRSWSRAC